MAKRIRSTPRKDGFRMPGEFEPQEKIWMYMKVHPDVTNYWAIVRGVGVTRHTAAKWYEMIRGILGRAA